MSEQDLADATNVIDSAALQDGHVYWDLRSSPTVTPATVGTVRSLASRVFTALREHRALATEGSR
ncbi:MAG TPA: hypothetical protein VFE19_03125 [Jatrophihabitantaceae bacterium]|jgi:hypothetical protein|nr:hypothetical protein [Jatrophihabitantaceae bacterium]